MSRWALLNIASCLILAANVTAQEPAGAVIKAVATQAGQVEFFEKHIRPVLVEKCYQCHSAQSDKVKGKLLLDTQAGTLKGGEQWSSVVPGDLKKSLLIVAIKGQNPDLVMPPKDSLTKDQVARFEEWVKMGAPDPRTGQAMAVQAYDYAKARQFWSFQPITNPTPLMVQDGNWSQLPIDRFVSAAMVSKGVKPVGETDRRTLIRRATFDLTGLPPLPQDVQAFINDKSPTAYEKLIDRLLASPAYGEKWGRLWLDVVRYADTSGCNSDYPIPDAWRYRNYVIESFNQDKPYNEFLREQLAGDLLPARNVEDANKKKIATGYLAIARRFGSRNDEFHLTIEDIIDNMGKSMLGLSVSCARCHDHKFDPIPTSDYYALFGIFNSTTYSFPGTEIYHHAKDLIALGSEEDKLKLEAFEKELAALDDRYEIVVREKDRLEAKEKQDRDLAVKGQPGVAANGGIGNLKPDAGKAGLGKETQGKALLEKPAPGKAAVEASPSDKSDPSKARKFATSAEARAQLLEIKERQKELETHPPQVQKAFAVRDAVKINDARIHIKGEPRKLGTEVRRGFLTILGGQKLDASDKSSGRLQLADWIVDPKNPLTARVMVNRLWQGHFGKGIVATTNDFGIRGQAPTNLPLLDHLATQFIASNWSVKTIHRQIMLSRTYQQSCLDDENNSAIDFANDTNWRFAPRRLSAEEIRDSVMFVSGMLDQSLPTGHPFPPEVEWKYTQHKPFYGNYDTAHRSVYLMQQRIRKQPYLAVFDGADTNASTPNRSISTTAIQALWMMNDPFFHDASFKLATRISKDQTEPASQINQLYQLTLQRKPTPEESRDANDFLKQMELAMKATDARDIDRARKAALASLARVLMAGNEFLFPE